MKHIVRLGNYKIYSTQCQACDCEFVFTHNEFAFYPGGKYVECPQCGHYIHDEDVNVFMSADAACPRCKIIQPTRHLHDEVCGIEGTHLQGSERFECAACGYQFSRNEAESLGLKYILDKEKP